MTTSTTSARSEPAGKQTPAARADTRAPVPDVIDLDAPRVIDLDAPPVDASPRVIDLDAPRPAVLPPVRPRRSVEVETRPAQVRPHVLFVCSNGGHLAQLVTLSSWWSGRERSWVCFEKPDATSQLADEKVTWAHHPTTRSLRNLIRNFFLAVRMMRTDRPDVVVSTGAGVAVPFFMVARLLGIKTVYLEVYDRLDSPTLTGRLIRPFTSRFLVQWEEQLKLYRNAELVGPVW
jgi:oligosaccharide biosynthesis protein Alg14